MPKRAPVHRPPRPGGRVHWDKDHRGKTKDRGYDAQWRKLRAAKLAADPLCQCDDCQAGAKRVTPANVVDHIIPIAERPDLRLVWDNLRSMHKTCHDRHTARTQAFGRGRVKSSTASRP